MRTWRGLLLAALALAPTPACLASSVLEEEARAAGAEAPRIEWRAASREDVAGLWSSVEIEGGAAAVLHEVHYWFAGDGHFTGAALVRVPALEYTVLSGNWRFEDGLLYLSADGLPARLEASAGLLRLASEEGVLVLRRRSSP